VHDENIGGWKKWIINIKAYYWVMVV
jgi:hypothetical protein